MERSSRTVGEPLPSGVIAFLFTDIEGSTRRWDSDAAAMEEALARHDALLRTIFRDQQAHVFKTMGDQFCVAFTSPSAAVEAALAAQYSLAAADFAAVGGIAARMAIHVGEVQARDGDYFGPPLNRVARLLSIAHGGQVILSGTAAAMLRDRLPPGIGLIDLGLHRLKDLAQPESVFQVTGPNLPHAFPALRSLTTLPHNLPIQLTSFVGRTTDLESLTTLIGSQRLVSLLGPGGLGKTRLSLQAGAELLTQFPDGVWFVELAPLAAPELIGEALATLFGVTIPGGADSLVPVVQFLKQKHVLLILDNCEHLLDEAARVAATILAQCESVKIVASSRERLGVAGEYVYRLEPLGLPSVTETITAEAAMGYSAVRLFVDRAALVLGGWHLTDETAADVVEICRRLDGIALAIELAAPRLKLLKPQELLLRLNDRFRLLTGGDRTRLPRQQTLRALIDWSHNLLSEPEKQVFRRLSVFAGDFALDDATAVIGDETLEEWDILDHVASLLEKSLIIRHGDESATSRYRMLESTHAYAADKLKESGEATRLRDRLVAFLVDRFQTADREYPTAATDPWLATYAPLLESLRAALDWCFAPDGDRQAGVALVAYSIGLWDELFLPREQSRWLEQAAAEIDATTPPGIEGRIKLGRARPDNSWSPIDEHDLADAEALFRRAAEPLGIGRALTAQGIFRLRRGDVEGAERFFLDAHRILKPLGKTGSLSTLLNAMATARHSLGDQVGEKAFLEQSVELERQIGTRIGLLLATLNLAEMEFSVGETDKAITLAREAAAVCRRGNIIGPLAMLCTNLTGYFIQSNNIPEAGESAKEGLELNLSLGQNYFLVICLEYLALVGALSGKFVEAARVSGYCDQYYRSIGQMREPTELASWHRLTETLSVLEQNELDALKKVGAEWDIDTVTQAAREIDLLFTHHLNG
jgi:predicted ATPase/class 3 adenylate cyclase